MFRASRLSWCSLVFLRVLVSSWYFFWLPARNPDGRRPGQLTIVLLDTHIVIRCAGRGFRVGERESAFRLAWLNTVEIAVVLDDVHTLDGRCADRMDLQLRRGSDRDRCSHQMLAALRVDQSVVEQDVVGCTVSPAGAHRIDQLPPGQPGYIKARVRKMRRNVVGACLDTQFVTLGERIPVETKGAVAALEKVRPVGGGALGRPFILVRIAEALIDLDQRLQRWVVVAPVGPLIGSNGVGERDSAVVPEVLVQFCRAFLSLTLIKAAGKGPHSPVIKNNITVAVGIGETALVAEEGRERIRYHEKVTRFLRPPPRVFEIVAGPMIGYCDKIQSRSIECITIEVKQRPISYPID